MVIAARVVITGMVTAGVIRAGGISVIRRVVRCHRRHVTIMAITGVGIMTTVADMTGDTVEGTMTIMAGMAITVINPMYDTNKNGTAQTVPFYFHLF
jgi:hypothetical protein